MRAQKETGPLRSAPVPHSAAKENESVERQGHQNRVSLRARARIGASLYSQDSPQKILKAQPALVESLGSPWVMGAPGG